MQGLRTNCGLFWARKKAGLRQPLLIFSPLWGTPDKARFRQRDVILSPLLGTPKNARVV